MSKSTHHEKIKFKKSTINITKLIDSCIVNPEQLKKRSHQKQLPKTTATAPNLALDFGQQRAIHALETAFSIKSSGYNVFAVGETGLGKRTFIQHFLAKKALPQGQLADWVYVYNFANPHQPIALSVTAGTAKLLVQQINELWQHLQNLEEQKTPNEIIKSSFKSILSTYKHDAELCAYLQMMQQDMLANFTSIITNITHLNQKIGLVLNHHASNTIPWRYKIHIMQCHEINQYQKKSKLGDNSENLSLDSSIPVIYVNNFSNKGLLGNIQKLPIQTLEAPQYNLTSLLDIQPGLLHQANGGYLILEAKRLLENPTDWYTLKYALQSHLITINKNDFIDPTSIPLNVKVVLLGNLDTYEALYELDPELSNVFKIRADFHEEINRTPQTELAMVAKMADIIKAQQLLPFDSTAQVIVLENLSRQAEDQNKLSMHTSSLTQILVESDRYSKLASLKYVSAKQVKQALNDIQYRAGYLKELYLQELTNGQQLITTSGFATGQLNALTIIDYAEVEFGMPARLTAVVQHFMGSGDILDIERDVELGGSLHAKGMLIMNSYLRGLFSPYHPLNFTASLAFEQSYAHIDGDSATLAEACALLSALANVPISQSLAITGSMNQLGIVQAVGGINAKVSGFFETCLHTGLTGNQGVIIPHANINQLMLDDTIIDAVKAGKFHIYGVKTLSEALTILTQMPVDTLNKQGLYHKNTLFAKVINNLKKWDEQLHDDELEEKNLDVKTKKTKKLEPKK